MYLVDFKTFREFLKRKGQWDKPLPVIKETPCILEYREGDKLLGKVEVVNLDQFLFLIKYPNSSIESKNKYWIRGEEWRVVNSKQIQELIY